MINNFSGFTVRDKKLHCIVLWHVPRFSHFELEANRAHGLSTDSFDLIPCGLLFDPGGGLARKGQSPRRHRRGLCVGPTHIDRVKTKGVRPERKSRFIPLYGGFILGIDFSPANMPFLFYFPRPTSFS